MENTDLPTGPVQTQEVKAGLIALGTACLWFTDFAHSLPPVIPALIALTVILTPGIGLLSWREFERDMAWSNFFVIATSLSLAHGLISRGWRPGSPTLWPVAWKACAVRR